MATKKAATTKPGKSADAITYHFNVGVTVDDKDGVKGATFREGQEVGAEKLPAHTDLQTLIKIGAIRPVEDAD